MSNLRVEVSHPHSVQEAQRRLSSFSADLAKVHAHLNWKGTRAEVSGVGVSGEVSLDPGKVVVALRLGLVARAAGVDPVRLETSIRRRLEAAMAG